MAGADGVEHPIDEGGENDGGHWFPAAAVTDQHQLFAHVGGQAALQGKAPFRQGSQGFGQGEEAGRGGGRNQAHGAAKML
ncbi:MAG: hypothetical protein BGO92_02555 [Magnetospirillum sp. 64-120]|nr:MAG: hypothetical protein BGO92_02555 [Magnetospirillum sp. 64-120]